MDRVDYQSLIIQDLFNDHADKKLNLNPWYQRRSIWTRAQKSYLVNTLFERKPIPAIYIRHTIDLEKQRSIKEIVDGQQRCRSVLEYCANEFSARIGQEGERKFFRDLNAGERERFLLTPLPVGFLLGASDEDVIDIFARINSISKTLNSQEKRNARFGGEIKQFCLGFSSRNLAFWRNAGVFTANDIARMNEVLFVSDLVFNLLNGLSDYRPSALNKMYEDHEDEFPEAADVVIRLSRVFDAFVTLKEDVFKDTIFRRSPILFSLVICLDQKPGRIQEDLADKLYLIDAEFQDTDTQNPEIVTFREAVSASTQRLSSRLTRHDFLNSRL